MRKLCIVLAIVAGMMAVVPASGTPEEGDCSSTTALGLGDAATAECVFVVDCRATVECAYSVALDVSGTGQVTGTMTAEVVFGLPDAEAFFVDFNKAERTTPTCGPALFNCSFTTSDETLVQLLVNTEGASFTLVRITCTAGGLALVESVGCSIT